MDGVLMDPVLAPRRWRFDVDALDRMVEVGVLGPDDRVELIEGELIAMPADGTPHIWTVAGLNALLSRALGPDYWLLVQSTFRLDQYNQPEPDLVVVRRPMDRSRRPEPADALLLIEVADSSLRYDATIKRALYARHGIREMWVVDVEGGAIEVAREPGPDGYAMIRRRTGDELVEPEALPGVRLAVRKVLPKMV